MVRLKCNLAISEILQLNGLVRKNQKQDKPEQERMRRKQ